MYYRSGRRNKKFIQIRNDDKDDHLLIRCVFYFMEIWKDVLGYEGIYQVSDLGNVKSLDRVSYHPRFGDMNLKGGIKKQCNNRYGYLMVGLHKEGRLKSHTVHRLVAIAFIPNPENKSEVNHKFGNKKDNRAIVLEWNTQEENIEHAIRTGLSVSKGEYNSNSKLTESQVLEIRKNTTKTMRQMSIEYNVVFSCISGIIKRKTWKHI